MAIAIYHLRLEFVVPTKPLKTPKQLAAENEELRARLEEAEETLRAIRAGEVDALVVATEQGERIFTLKGAEHSYRVLIEDMNEGAVTLSLDGSILYCNRRFAEMLKAPLEKVIGSSFRDWVTTESQTLLPEFLQQDGELSRRRAEVTLRASDGSVVSSHLSVNDLRTEELSGYFCMVVTDLTEHRLAERAVAAEKAARENLESSERSRRVLLSMLEDQKRVEKALRESEEKYRGLFENIPDGIFRSAPDGRILAANPALASMLGYESPQELMQSVRAQDLYADSAQRDRMLTVLAERGEIDNLEFVLKRRDGTTRVFLENARAMRDESGKILYFEGVLTDITERKQAEEKVHRQMDYLTALRNIDRTIASTFDVRLSLNSLIAQAVSVLGVDAASILLVNSTMNTLRYAAGQGFRARPAESTEVKMGESLAGKAALDRRLVSVQDLSNLPPNLPLNAMLKDEMFVEYYGVPLIVKGKVVGVLEVYQRSSVERDQEWFDFLDSLAGQAAIAIDNAQLFQHMQSSNTELILAYDATIEGWSRAMDLRDKETEGHTQRVTELTQQLAKAMGLSSQELVHIRRGALLHDIGKMGIPDSILRKPGQLTPEEWATMKQHPTFAYEMLQPIKFLHPALDIPYCHHEKWDGSGYPRGLKGEQIPLAARLFAVVDVWDALTSDRPYREAWSKQKTLDYIREQSGTHFDPKVVDLFMQVIKEKLSE